MAEALRERAQRIYEKYGNVMLETEGMTKAGIQRKATTRCAGCAGRWGMCWHVRAADAATALQAVLSHIRWHKSTRAQGSPMSVLRGGLPVVPQAML